jgi:hypothetical protein
MGKFKHSGPLHWAHNLPGTAQHAKDAAAQKRLTDERQAVAPQRRRSGACIA